MASIGNECDCIKSNQLKKQSATVVWNIPVFGVALNIEDNPQK